MRLIEFNDKQIYTCPNGCDESELELGKDQQSFMAIIGSPYKYIRCGKCLFGDEDKQAKLDMAEVIDVWNKKCTSWSSGSSGAVRSNYESV